MRIGFIGPFAKMNNANYASERQVGAIEHQIFGLAKELSLLGHELYITRNWKGKNKEDFIEGIHFLNINCFNSIEQGFNDSKFPLNHLSHAYYVARAPKLIANMDLDVINVSRVFSGWFALEHIRSHRSHSVFITHDNDIYVTAGLGHSRLPYWPRKTLRVINKRYDATVAVTKGIKEYFTSIGLSCHAIIPEAIDPNEYKCLDEEGFILTAERLVPHKRVEDLIQAYSEISDDIEEDLVIIGSGPCEKPLRRYAASLNLKERIRFIPFLPKSKYRDYLSKCSIFVLPSVAEAFGVVIIEAMASGKPVIARNIIGPRDIITNRHDGFLFENVDELEKYLQLLLSDEVLRKKLGKNARKTVEEKYTFDKIARQYLIVYESLIN